MTERRYCEDCKHARPWWGFLGMGRWEFAQCAHPLVVEDKHGGGALTHRRKHAVGFYLSTERKFGCGKCGPAGKLWEPK